MKDVQRIYISHTLNTVALSIISVYIPAYLLTLGYPLSRVILFYIISHGVGLIIGLFLLVPFSKKWGLLNTFKLYYPMQVLYLILLSILKQTSLAPEIVAFVSGFATFAYWIPMNIFLVKYSNQKEMGSNLAKFVALPNLFRIFGPLIGAVFIPLIGFWPVFMITVGGLFISFIPIASVNDKEFLIDIDISKALRRLWRNKVLFSFEFLDNVIEESEWFWSIYVYILIGTLTTPGIVGSLEAIGGSVFTLVIGKYANTSGKKLIPIAAISLLILTLLKIFVQQPFTAYIITVLGSFVLSMFMISYYSTIYRTVKNDNEEEFMILREIPTVIGRMVVFSVIYLTMSSLKLFFILPFIAISLLILIYMVKRKILAD